MVKNRVKRMEEETEEETEADTKKQQTTKVSDGKYIYMYILRIMCGFYCVHSPALSRSNKATFRPHIHMCTVKIRNLFLNTHTHTNTY